MRDCWLPGVVVADGVAVPVRGLCSRSASEFSKYRPHERYPYEGGRNNILNDGRQYKLAAIEFGELGSYADADKGELNNTIQLLKNTERPLLVVYIHGWLNNATSGDLGKFKGFLSSAVPIQTSENPSL